jgi:hypothetical protein
MGRSPNCVRGTNQALSRAAAPPHPLASLATSPRKRGEVERGQRFIPTARAARGLLRMRTEMGEMLRKPVAMDLSTPNALILRSAAAGRASRRMARTKVLTKR